MKICDKHDELKQSKLMNFFRNKSFTFNDDPLQNLSRRFFESILSLKLWTSLSENEFKSIEKLSTIVKEINPKLNPLMHITSHEDANSIIALLRTSGEVHPDVIAIHDSLRRHSIISAKKDRGSQREKTFSCNPGILKSFHPCFSYYKKKSELGRIVDMFNIDEKKHGFSSHNKHVPFVNSVSGTIFTIVSILNLYMKKYQDSQDLAADVNHIIKAFLAFACMNGYHSLAEMFCVLTSSEITKSFEKFSIILDLSFPENVVKLSYEESVVYTKKLLLQDLMHLELESRFKPT